ncbi:MAG: 4Fe-4S ferredoxin [Rhodothermaceae bacterium]|nr:MAG: 4Fe-4S ferredoxin [Rhodothermaceae bacterium]
MNRLLHTLPVIDHPAAAARFLHDADRATWHDASLWQVRRKRDRAAAMVEEWEELRALASAIKEHTLSHLDTYLEAFEQHATANGIQVHWAADAAEHNRIVLDLLRRHGARRVVKSKSMLTEECGLNPFLEAHGIEVVDTDLGERIVQLANDAPSHIVMPAIHYRQEEIGALFHAKMGTEAGADEPAYLAAAARRDLRRRFLEADAAITGVNFAVAETGGFVVCTNEGNADLGAHLAPLHIACMGLEKVIPRLDDLGVFLRLLARSATGQPITVYTSHFHRPPPGRALHVVLVDNGRSAQLARPAYRASLKCIRCGACLNTCPVYRRSGGHSYGAPVPGPIGSILMPGTDPVRYASLPFASTLCGSCSDVCPVQIDIHDQLYAWRQDVTRAGGVSRAKRWFMQMAGWLLAHPRRYRVAGAALRRLLRHLPRRLLYARPNTWGRARELPPAPPQTFRDWYRAHRPPPEHPADMP